MKRNRGKNNLKPHAIIIRSLYIGGVTRADFSKYNDFNGQVIAGFAIITARIGKNIKEFST